MPLQDKLSLINDCLDMTGQHQVAVADNGSREWRVASAGYETGLQRLLDEHDWKFAKVVEFVEERTDPDDAQWGDSYTRPNSCMHVIRIMDEDGGAITSWKIVGDQIWVNYDAGILVEFVHSVEPDQFTGLFTAALKHFIFAGIYRGLMSQPADARAEEKKGEELIKSARPRGDLEEPGKTRFVSSLARARGTRRG